jgi:osmotically-inducible protein OsmY
VVSGVGGVRAVDNRIGVGPVSQRPDAEIEAEVESRLRFDAWLEESFIEVAVADGRVELSGRVASPAERSRAYRDAWVAGVAAVDNDGLEIEPDLRGEREIKLRRARIPDDEIAEAISAAWLYDPRVRSGELGVTVDDGVALVTGVVQTIEARRAAVRDARHTRGVWRVEDRLRVASPVDRDDSRLKARIIEQLRLDPLIPAADIEVLVEDGRVVLLGSVPDARAGRRAQTLVARVRGVEAVDDRLQPARDRQREKPAGDDALRAEVLRELRFNPTLRPDSVQVQAERGVVTLRGTVDRWTQRLEAAREAFQAGAVEVNNLLRVREAGAPAPGELDAARTDR